VSPHALSPAEPGSPRYFAWLYSTEEARAVLEPLLGIEREIESSLRPGLEHAVAHIRLEWWRGEAARLAGGTPAHPLTQRLLAAGGEAVRTSAELGGLVDAAAWDLATATFETRAELDRHCERWACAVTQPLAHAGAVTGAATAGAAADSGAGDAAALAFARRAGAALREIELLLDAVHEARAGRLRVPLDELEARGIEPAALARSPWPAALDELVQARLDVLRARLAEAVATLAPGAQPALRGLLVWCALAHRHAGQAAAGAMPPAPPSRSSVLRDAWTAWRSARRAAGRRARLQ